MVDMSKLSKARNGKRMAKYRAYRIKKNMKKELPFCTIIYCILTIVIALISFVKPYTDYSAFENRILSHIQRPTFDGVMTGTWFGEFETANLDQIIGRNVFIEINSRTLEFFGKREINSIIVSNNNDCLLQNSNEITDYDWMFIDNAVNDSFINRLCSVKEITDSYNGQLYYLNIYPRESFLYNKYPYINDDIIKYNDEREALMLNEISQKSIEVVDTSDMFKEHYDEYLYFYTDHHYTQKGAYYSYLKLLNAINDNNPEKDRLIFPSWEDMNYVRIDKPFMGSLIQQIGDTQYVDADYLEYALPYDYPGDYDRYEFGGISDLPLVRNEEISEYGWFMNGDNGNTVIKTFRPELPNILIIGYSFTDALELLSIYNFNEMHSIDPRRIEFDIYDYIKKVKCDYVVIQGECEF